MTLFDRITFDPQIMGGRACIRGMRIPVSVIVGQIANNATVEEILAGYPELEPADIQQCFNTPRSRKSFQPSNALQTYFVPAAPR